MRSWIMCYKKTPPCFNIISRRKIENLNHVTYASSHLTHSQLHTMIFTSFTVTHAHIILLPLQHHHHTGTTTASLYYQPIFAEVEWPEPPSNVSRAKLTYILFFFSYFFFTFLYFLHISIYALNIFQLLHSLPI